MAVPDTTLAGIGATNAPEAAFARATTQTRVAAATLLILFGGLFLFGVGFAHADLAHNAAHDARHAFTFPCH